LCKHFLPERVGVCAEDRADPPVEKENANFCDFFRPASAVFEQSTHTKRLDASAALARLFDDADVETAATPEATSSDESAAEPPTAKTPIDLLNELFVTPPKKP
jgi:hypothetical protein